MSKDSPDPIQPPEVFVLAIGGFFGKSFRVERQGGTLSYVVWSREANGWETPQTEEPLPPIEPDWPRLRDTLDEFGVWQWQPVYELEGSVDGTGWGLEIRWGERHVKSRGRNKYPERFREFLAALREQLGGRELH